ncbi:MAG TPA: hypothetical protein ACFYEA_07460 [Candidatus Tripitaka californicus]
MNNSKYMIGTFVKCDYCKEEFAITEIVETSKGKKGKQTPHNICPTCKRISNYFLENINRVKSFS